MAEHISDPIFTAIESHRLVDAAYDDSLERGADEPIKEARRKQEGSALIALLLRRCFSKPVRHPLNLKHDLQREADVLGIIAGGAFPKR
jgi:hypothetical protein